LLEQHMNIKFCAKLGKSMSETLQMLTETYGADAMKKSSVSEWHKMSTSYCHLTNLWIHGM
jgi:hypothetical protein